MSKALAMRCSSDACIEGRHCHDLVLESCSRFMISLGLKFLYGHDEKSDNARQSIEGRGGGEAECINASRHDEANRPDRATTTACVQLELMDAYDNTSRQEDSRHLLHKQVPALKYRKGLPVHTPRRQVGPCARALV